MDPVTLLVVALVCAAVGYFAGFLVSGVARVSRDTGVNKNKPRVESQGQPDLDAGEIELARLVRANPGGPLQVVASGKRWESSSQLGEPQRASLENLLIDFQRWLVPGITSPLEQAPRPAAVEAAPAAPPFYPSPQIAALTAQLVKTTAPEEPKTIVGQIDQVLQDLLPGSAFADRKIRLLEVPNQGVIVQVDRDQYPGIDSVPDQEIRGLIRQAVSTWEARPN